MPNLFAQIALAAFLACSTQFLEGGECMNIGARTAMWSGGEKWKPVDNSYVLISNPIYVEIGTKKIFQRGDEVGLEYMCVPWLDWFGSTFKCGYSFVGDFSLGLSDNWTRFVLKVIEERDYHPVQYNLIASNVNRRFRFSIVGETVQINEASPIPLPNTATASKEISLLTNFRGRFYRYYHKRNGIYLTDIYPMDNGDGSASFYDLVSGSVVSYSQRGIGELVYGIDS